MDEGVENQFHVDAHGYDTANGAELHGWRLMLDVFELLALLSIHEFDGRGDALSQSGVADPAKHQVDGRVALITIYGLKTMCFRGDSENGGCVTSF